MSDTEIGSAVGMTPKTVRQFTKRAKALMIAQGAATRSRRGDVLPLKRGRRDTAGKNCQ